jgi:hypothetical protein
MKETERKSGGRSGRRAAGREKAFGTDDDDERPFWRSGENKLMLKFKLRNGSDQQLAVGDELDDALMFRRVRVFVDAMVQGVGCGEKLQREVKPKHERDGENLSLHSRSFGNW